MNIGIVGVGNMGGAIADGLLTSSDFLNSNLYLFNRTKTKIDRFEMSNANICDSADELIARCEIIILAIKPNQYQDWLDQYATDIQNKLLITIAAGISSNFLSNYTSLFSITMPNMGSSVGNGYTVICVNKSVNSDISNILIEESTKIFKNLGFVKVIEEEQLSEHIALLGSSPAYFINIVNQMKKHFVDLGYNDKEVERDLAYIMLTSAKLMLSSENNASQIVDSICSPNGTTIAAINTLNNSDLESVFESAIQSCIVRADEMLKENEEKLIK